MAVYASICITGANRGIGLELVRQFLEVPHPPKHLFALCRKPAEAQELNSLASKNASLHLLELDITDTTHYDRVVSQVGQVVGSDGLSLLINNAGIMNKNVQGIADFTKQDMMHHFEVNTVSPVLLTQAFLPLLKQAAAASPAGPVTKAVVVFVSSKLGCFFPNLPVYFPYRYSKAFLPLLKQAAAASPADPVTKAVVVFVSSKLGCFFPNIPKNFPYRYTKAALNMATHCLAMELKPAGVLVMAVHPGHVKTDMGGPNGAVEKDSSASGLIKVITGLEEKHRGKLYQFDGTEMEW